MTKRLFVLLAVLLLAAAPAWAEGPITKREARTLPSGQVQRRVLGQLRDIFVRDPANPKANPTRPLDVLTFEARPHGTAVPGVCEIDTLAVQFEAFGTPARDADTPVRATGFSSSTSFALLREIQGDFISQSAVQDRSGTPECADPKAKFLTVFDAPDMMTAVDGLEVLSLARKAARTLGPSLTCSWMNEKAADQCPLAIEGLKLPDIYSITRCELEPGLVAGEQCLSILTADSQVKLVFVRTGAGVKLHRIRADWTMIIADQRID